MTPTARTQWLSDIDCLRWFARDAAIKLRDELAAVKPSLVATSLRVVAADATSRAFHTALAALERNDGAG